MSPHLMGCHKCAGVWPPARVESVGDAGCRTCGGSGNRGQGPEVGSIRPSAGFLMRRPMFSVSCSIVMPSTGRPSATVSPICLAMLAR